MRGTALGLISFLSVSWQDAPHLEWDRVFGELVPQLLEAAEGTGTMTPEDLRITYAYVLCFRGQFGEHWPDELDFEELVDAVHAVAPSVGLAADALAAEDFEQVVCFHNGGRLAEARTHLQRVVGAYDPETAYLPQLLMQLAAYARHCHEYAEARSWLDEMEALLEARRESLDDVQKSRLDEQARGLLHLERAAYLTELGLPDLALPEIEEARVLADALGLEWLQGGAVFEELNALAALERTELVRSRVEEALRSSWYGKLTSDAKLQYRVRAGLARAEESEEDWTELQLAVEELHAVLDLPGLPPDERQLTELYLARLELEVEDFESVAERLARVRASMGSGPVGCANSLPSRREVELTVLEARLAVGRSASPDELREHLVTARAALYSLLERWATLPGHDGGLSLLLTRDRLGAVQAVVELVLAVEGEEAGVGEALELVGRVQALGSLARAVGAEAPTREDVVRSLVPPEGGLLVYLPGASRTHVFCIDADRMTVHGTVGVERIDDSRQAFHGELGRSLRGGPTTGLEPTRVELEERLLPQEVRDRIRPWRDLVIVGVDAIGYVPFELLHVDEERLGDTRAISYLPSLPVGAWLARRRPLPAALEERELFVVAAPDAGGVADTSLTFGPSEEERLLGRCALASEVLHGEEATLEALETKELAECFGLQVVAHGVDAGRADRPIGLGLHGVPGILTPARAESLSAPPLVVLTACGAWRGPVRRGDDGRHHLGGAFFLAGARTVVLSHLDVDYQQALATMGAFYEGLTQRGDSPARAMLGARRTSMDDSLFPYLIHVGGLAHEPWVEPGRPARWPFFAGAGVLALLGFALFYRRRPGAA